MAFERIGATGDSLRLRNNDWFIARSADGSQDIKVFRINDNNQIEFNSMPTINGNPISEGGGLESRIAAIESVLYGVNAGQVNIVPVTITQPMLTAKKLTLPQIPFTGKILLFPQHGIPQFCNIDFSVVGDQLSWDGFELSFDLGEKIKILYMY